MYAFEDESPPSRAPMVLAVASAAVLGLCLVAAVLVARRPAADSRPTATTRRTPEPWTVPAPPEDTRPAPRPPVVKADPDPPLVVTPPSAKADPPRPPATTPLPPVVPEPAKYPPLEPGRLVYGEYRLVKIRGFPVYLNRTVLEESARLGGRPLDCLQDELERLSRLPAALVRAMQTIKVFVEWDHVEAGHPNTVAVFYGGGGEGLTVQGVLPFKAGHITILSLKRVAAQKQGGGNRKGVVILHEMAHAAHHYSLGDANPFVQNAYDQAMTRGLYKSVPDDRGGTARAYAATNEFEYFAEITCAYLDWCDYFPHDRRQLRDYDSVGYELMRKVWGDRP